MEKDQILTEDIQAFIKDDENFTADLEQSMDIEVKLKMKLIP